MLKSWSAFIVLRVGNTLSTFFKNTLKSKKMIIGFEDKDTTYAKLLIKLKHEGVTKREFFRGVVGAFLEDNPSFMVYLLDFKKRKNLYTKTKQKILDKERKVSYNTEKQMGLSKDEVNELFDMFDEELGV